MKGSTIFTITAIGVFLGIGLWVSCNQKKEPPKTTQWFCKTIADLDTDSVKGLKPYQRAVAYKGKFWPVGYSFKVGFVSGTASQKDFVKKTCVQWSKFANVKFTFPAAGPYDLRIGFNPNDGAWSYVGTDIKSITGATMNLGWLDVDVVLHEFGHSLGLLHEHQNPTSPIKWNEAAVIRDLSGSPNYWDEETIRHNVLSPYLPENVITTALDKMSIMMYPIPQSWTLDGFTTPGGRVISDVDSAFIGKVYPFSEPPITGSVTLRVGQVDTLIMRQNELLKQFDQTTSKLKDVNELTKKYLGRQ